MFWPMAVLALGLAGGDVVARLGPQKALLESGRLGLEFFPDTAMTVLQRRPFRALMVAGVATYLVGGQDVDSIESAKRVLGPGPKGSPDNGYAGIGGATSYRGTLYGLVHGEDHEGMPKLAGGNVPGYYGSLGLASSTDGGETWRRHGLALTSHRPKSWSAFEGQADRGVGEACIYRSRDGRYAYALFVDHSRDGDQGVQIHLARADLKAGPPLPGRWLKWLDGKFATPGVGGRSSPVISAWASNRAEATFPHVAFSKAMDRFVLVYNVHEWAAPEGGLGSSGIYLATSKDGVSWSAGTRIVPEYAVGQYGRPVAWHPTLVWDDARGDKGWLLYGYSEKLGHPSNQSGIPHALFGRRIELTR